VSLHQAGAIALSAARWRFLPNPPKAYRAGLDLCTALPDAVALRDSPNGAVLDLERRLRRRECDQPRQVVLSIKWQDGAARRTG